MVDSRRGDGGLAPGVEDTPEARASYARIMGCQMAHEGFPREVPPAFRPYATEWFDGYDSVPIPRGPARRGRRGSDPSAHPQQGFLTWAEMDRPVVGERMGPDSRQQSGSLRYEMSVGDPVGGGKELLRQHVLTKDQRSLREIGEILRWRCPVGQCGQTPMRLHERQGRADARPRRTVRQERRFPSCPNSCCAKKNRSSGQRIPGETSFPVTARSVRTGYLLKNSDLPYTTAPPPSRPRLLDRHITHVKD